MRNIPEMQAQVERQKASLGRRFWKALGEQFGVTLPDPEEVQAQVDALAASEATPEERRQAMLELEAATRGKEVVMAAQPPAPAFSAPAAAPTSVEDPIDPDGTVHFDRLYAQAGVAPAKFTAEQALELLQDSGADEAARRQTIKVIAAFGKNVGATPDEIVVDATDKQDALQAFMEHQTDDLAAFQAKGEDRLARLQQEADRIRGLLQEAQTQRDHVVASCQAEHARLEQVRDFFRREVPSK